MRVSCAVLMYLHNFGKISINGRFIPNYCELQTMNGTCTQPCHHQYHTTTCDTRQTNNIPSNAHSKNRCADDKGLIQLKASITLSLQPISKTQMKICKQAMGNEGNLESNGHKSVTKQCQLSLFRSYLLASMMRILTLEIINLQEQGKRRRAVLRI